MNTQTDNSQTASNGDGEVLTNIETLIKSHIASIERRSTELKEYRNMLEDLLNNDAVYAKHSEEAKEKAKMKQSTKAQIMKRPDAYSLAEKIKNARAEKKSLGDALSDYLKEYQRLSGQTTFEDEDGNVQEIVYIARLKKKSVYTP